MNMNAQLTVLYAQCGFYEDSNTKQQMPWANLYTLGDIVITPNMVGLKPAKMNIVDHTGKPSHEVALKIMEKISISKTHPVQMNLKVGTKVIDGSLAMQIIGLAD